MSYLALKHIHLTCVLLSGLGFVLRGFWMLRRSARLQQKWVRWVPHVVDTGLLASAIALAVLGRHYPLVEPWLTAKVAALLLYIILGTVALKRGKTYSVRVVAFFAALLVFAYIVSVALTRNPYVW